MPRYAANIFMLFCEHAMLDRPAAAAAAGFAGIEIQFPYEHAPEAWAKALQRAGLPLVLFNLPVGDVRSGGPGLAAMPGREAAFAEAVAEALDYAEVLRPACVNVLAGFPPAALARADCHAVLAGNLRLAAERFAPLGTRVLVEAVNGRDRPGFFLQRSTDAIAAIEAAGHANLAIQHDLYHMQIMEGDLVATLERQIARIGHIQFADVPGRHEPGTGEINFRYIFAALDGLGYDGWLGAEYQPSRRTEETLDWMKP